MSKLTKSLSELDAMADELLAKSQLMDKDVEDEETEMDETLEKADTPDKDEAELNPEDVSENVPEESVKGSDAPEEKEEEESENEDESEEEEEKEETIEKSLNEEDEEPEEEDDEEEDDEEENEENEEPVEETEEQVEKSIRLEFTKNDTIRKSIDASEFLSAVTEVISNSLAKVVSNMNDSSRQSSDSNDVLAKSLQASLSLNKAMSDELNLLKSQNSDLKKSLEDGLKNIKDYVTEQLEEFSHQPVSMRKSVSNVSVNDRNFQKSLNGQSGGSELSKSEVLSKLNAYMYSGNPLVQPSDIISYESGAPLRPEVAQLINSNM